MSDRSRKNGLRGGVCAAAVWVGAFFLLTHVVAAQEALSAEQVFENFRAVYAQSSVISADFVETTIMDGQRRTAKGHLLFKKPNLVRQEYFDPKDPNVVAQLIVLDGKMSWSYTPWLNQVTRKAMSPTSAKELLQGAGPELEDIPKNFTLSLEKDEAAAAKGIYLLRIVPKAREGAAANEVIEVWIRSSDWTPAQFSYTNVPNGVTTVVSLQQLDLTATPPPDAFQFEIPQGVEVITITDDYQSDG